MANRRRTAHENDMAGNPSRRPHLFEPTPAVTVDPKDFAPPDFLDEAAKAEWTRITSTQDECYPADTAALASYCTQYSRWQKAEAELAGQPLTQMIHGREQTNPLVKISENTQKLMLAYARELGFTPLARTRIPVKAEVNDDRDAFTVFMES